MLRTTHQFMISAHNTFMLHYKVEEEMVDTLSFPTGTPNVITVQGAADDPYFCQTQQRCGPGTWKKMECDIPFQVQFKGRCSAYSYAVVGSKRKLIFHLQRYPNLGFLDFFMNREAQIFIVTGKNEEDRITLRNLKYHPKVLGYHLEQDESYYIPTCEAIAVNTLTKARIRISGKPRFISVSPSPKMHQLRALMDHIDYMRLDAHAKGTRGPRVLVVGPALTGKTSLCHLFSNEAAELGRTPVFVDINVSRNSNTLPGAISLLKVVGERHLTNGFPGVPRVLPFGFFSIPGNRQLYILILHRAREILESMLSEDVTTRSSGVIIDACEISLMSDILELIEFFAINTVFVTTSVRDPLYGPNMNAATRTISVNYLPPEETGVVYYDKWNISDLRRRKFHEYFYGTRNNPRQITELTVPFDEVHIYLVWERRGRRVDSNNSIPADFLVERVNATPPLVDRAMAVIATNRGDHGIEIAGVHYFVCLFAIYNLRKRLVFLSPNSQNLSGATLWVMGSVR